VTWVPNLYQLKTLLAVAKYHTFRGAADEQHVTVSAISQQMLSLSRDTRAVLYERRGNRIFLTPAGERLAEYARHIIHLAEEASIAMTESSKHRDIRISLVTSIAESVLPELYQRFRAISLDGTFSIDIKPGAEIIDDLNSGSVDVALLPTYDAHAENINRFFHETVFNDELVAVVHETDPLAAYDAVSINDLSRRKLFLESQGSPNCQLLLDRFRNHGVSPDVELFCANNSLAIRMALAARHVAVIPEVVARSSPEVRQYLPIVDGVARTLRFCCPTYILDEPYIEAFRRAVHSCFKQI